MACTKRMKWRYDTWYKLRAARCAPKMRLAALANKNLVLIFPDSAAPEASQALARLQQELAQTPLLYADDCLAMALSAGVVQKLPQETPQQTLQRAAQALRQAIRMGGQRVVLH